MQTGERWMTGSRMVAAVGLLSGVLALLAMPAGASAGATERVSVDSGGNQANGNSSRSAPSISGDGRFVAFESDASNLVPGDANGNYDVFVRDRWSGTTERVSGSSLSFSADGRFVAFASSSTDLVPGDTNGVVDVFVRDRWTSTTERVSVDSAGNQGNRASGWPAISADGRFVAFVSDATNLVPGDTNERQDVFVHDRQTGTTERVGVDVVNYYGGGGSPVISADGRFVAFTSHATDLVPGDTNGWADVFVYDRWTGTTERVSVDSAGHEAYSHSQWPAISADGRFVAFDTDAPNLVPGDTNDVLDVFVHDRLTGTTERVSVDSAGNQGNAGSSLPAISADGRFVVFWSAATNLVPEDTNAAFDVFIHDRQTGATERVSVDSAGNPGNYDSFAPALSADGRFVAFTSSATNLAPGDTNGVSDVFVHDRSTAVDDTTPPVRTNGQPSGTLPVRTTQATLRLGTNEGATCRYSTTPGVTYGAMTATLATTNGTAHAARVGGLTDGESYSFYVRCQDASGNANADDYPITFSVASAPPAGPTTERLSVDSAGNQGSGPWLAPNYSSSISADGRFVAFWSGAPNLVPGDTNGAYDVFVHDQLTRTTERVSVDSAGNEGNSTSFDPVISANGRFVAFASYATNLVPGDTNGVADVFVHDRLTGSTERVSVDSAGNQRPTASEAPAISANGRFVAFQSGDVFVHDRQTRTTERMSVDSAGNGGDRSSSRPAISADGRFVAFDSDATNLVPGDTNMATDVFVHDRQTGVTERVSVDSAGSQGSGPSFNPALSADGRFVAFESWAPSLVPGDTNSTNDVFVHDRQTRTTERVSVDSAGIEGNAASFNPAISADGRFVVFSSNAANLVSADTNGVADVFVHDRQIGITERVSVDSAGNQGDGRSYPPAISADGRFVTFASRATNLVPGDTNGTTDVFVRDRGEVGR